jgi:hypothetical protein
MLLINIQRLCGGGDNIPDMQLLETFCCSSQFLQVDATTTL